MAIGSAIFQGSTFLLIILTKSVFDADAFVTLVTQLAWASIFGAVATFRMEVLLVHERQVIDRSVLLTTICFALAILGAFGTIGYGIGTIIGTGAPASIATLLLALGFALHEAQSFFCVRMERVFQLIITRVAQGVFIGTTSLAAFLGTLSPSTTLLAYAASVSVPLLIWWALNLIRGSSSFGLILPDATTLKRGAFGTASLLLNTAYVNVTILIAAATQSAALVADFGFLLKLLTGPITLVRQAFGQTFLSRSLALNPAQDGARNSLMMLLLRTAKLAITSYGTIVLIMVVLVWFGAEAFSIHQPSMILWLALSTIPQAMVNPVASIRTTLRRENTFMLYDIFRLLALTVALILPLGLAFYVTFSLVSGALYLLYWVFILHQINHAFRPGQ